MTEKIVVLMLTWNRLEFTKKALQALTESMQQKPFLLVIFDNASQEPTQDYLMNAPIPGDYEIYFASRNLGVDEPMSWFFKNFDADVYGKVDNDTVVPQDWIAKMLQEMNQYDLDVIQARHYTMKKPIQELMEQTADERKPVLTRSCGGSGILVRKCFVERFGGPKASPGKLMDAWTEHLIAAHAQGARYGFSPSTWIDLLDMADHFMRAPGTEEYQELIKMIRGNG